MRRPTALAPVAGRAAETRTRTVLAALLLPVALLAAWELYATLRWNGRVEYAAELASEADVEVYKALNDGKEQPATEVEAGRERWRQEGYSQDNPYSLFR